MTQPPPDFLQSATARLLVKLLYFGIRLVLFHTCVNDALKFSLRHKSAQSGAIRGAKFKLFDQTIQLGSQFAIQDYL
jgi:hypothetical protein